MKIIVTDLTRFSNRDIVCLAGIDPETGLCIRPLIKNGAKGSYISFKGVKDNKVIPGSILEADFSIIYPSLAPHTEDHFVNEKIHARDSASSEQFESVLDKFSYESIIEGFGLLPNNRLYSNANHPQKSIITLKLTSPANQFKISADRYNEEKFKAHLIDNTGYSLDWLPVTDLGFSDHIHSIRRVDPYFINLNAFLHSQKVLYIRLGLTRQFSNPTQPDRAGYWIQVNGIYSFPNHREDLRIYD